MAKETKALYAYLTGEDGNVLKTPRGDLQIQYVFKTGIEAQKHGFEQYFTVVCDVKGTKLSVAVYVKHIDVYHCWFAVVDCTSKYVCKRITKPVWYALCVSRFDNETVIFETEEHLNARYHNAQHGDMIFKDWVQFIYKNKVFKVTPGTQFRTVKDIPYGVGASCCCGAHIIKKGSTIRVNSTGTKTFSVSDGKGQDNLSVQVSVLQEAVR